MEYKNILIIKMSSLGDVLHTLPFANALRSRFPNAKISWLVQPQFADFIPYPNVIDEVILFDKTAFVKLPLLSKIRYFLNFRRLLKSKNFDLSIDMQGLFKSAILAWASGCKNRIGYCEMRELSFLISRPICGENKKAHVIERYLDVARYLGAQTSAIEFPIADISEAEKSARDMLKAANVSDRYVVIAPSARWKTKEWILEHYIRLIRMIEQKGFSVVLVGSNADRQKSELIAASCEKARDFSGKTTLKELAAIIKNCAVFISADTGPLHFAAAFKKPLIALYGPTLPERTGPYGDGFASIVLTSAKCRGCLKKKCDKWHCMSDITPEMVYEIFKEKIDDRA